MKPVLDLYAEDYKILMKEVKDLDKYREILCSQIRRLNLVKMSVLHKLFNAITMKTSAKFCFVFT